MDTVSSNVFRDSIAQLRNAIKTLKDLPEQDGWVLINGENKFAKLNLDSGVGGTTVFSNSTIISIDYEEANKKANDLNGIMRLFFGDQENKKFQPIIWNYARILTIRDLQSQLNNLERLYNQGSCY